MVHLKLGSSCKRRFIYLFVFTVGCICTYQLSRRLPSKSLILGTYSVDQDAPEAFDFSSCREGRQSSRFHDIVGSPQIRTEFSCSHLITVSNYTGGLGNHMFKAAAVIGVAAKHNYTPVFAKRTKLFDIFELGLMIDFELNNTAHFREKICCEYNKNVEVLNHTKNWTLTGYLQSWKYFDGVEDKVREAFTFRPTFVVQTHGYLNTISRKGILNIGVHVGRGDFLSKENQKLGYVVAPVSYIQKAMKYFQDKFKTVQFIFASDDKKWCEDNFKGQNIIQSPFKEAALDMALLSSCDHVIITSGTFGWWIGWLSRGITVYFLGHPKMDSWLESQYNSSDSSIYADHYPAQWIGME